MTRSRPSLQSAMAVAAQVVTRLCIIAAALCLAIALVAFVQARSASQSVVRIAMNDVPVEKVVEFGHEERAFSMVLPVPADEVEPLFAQPAPPVETSAITAPAMARVTPDRNGVLPISFSLEEGATAIGGGVGVTKTIALQQGEMTGLKIFIVGDAMIEVERIELARALEAIGAGNRIAALPAAGRTGRLSLDHVRQAGLDLKYDPIRDRLVLNP